jgi:serine phosphatase RsbU (regulator of sigma subunit)
MFEDWQCAMAESQIDSGDILALYTDGVTESFNEAQEEFGEDRLIEALRRHCGLSAHNLAAAVVDEVALFSGKEQYDDITLIIAKRLG